MQRGGSELMTQAVKLMLDRQTLFKAQRPRQDSETSSTGDLVKACHGQPVDETTPGLAKLLRPGPLESMMPSSFQYNRLI